MTIRFGVLGAARITPTALLRPAGEVREVEVAAVAARDPARARTFAERHGIDRVVADYETLVNDPDVDAIYNALPNGLHGRWTMAAVRQASMFCARSPSPPIHSRRGMWRTWWARRTGW